MFGRLVQVGLAGRRRQAKRLSTFLFGCLALEHSLAGVVSLALYPPREHQEELTSSALMCTFPLLVSFYPADSKTGQNLPSLLSTAYCFGQLVFLGLAQRQVGRVSIHSLLCFVADAAFD